MRLKISWITLMALLIGSGGYAQSLSPDAWPSTTDFSQEVHFWSADGFLWDSIPAGKGGQFFDTLSIPSGGDQTNEEVEIGGKFAKRATNLYMNVADMYYDIWPTIPVIDVLVLYFANAESIKSNVGFLLGVVGNQKGYGGYQLESLTDAYEWHVFRLDNSEGRAGYIIDPPPSGSDFGGVNGGTIRFERVNNLIVRAIAFGPEGVFGDPEVINQVKTVEFNPDEYAIMAEWDPNQGMKNGIDLHRVNDGDQEVIESEDIGPAGDKRKAVRVAFDDGKDGVKDLYMNYVILDQHFGPSTQPSARIKVAVEYYDDPALAGVIFGPEAYKTTGGGIAHFPPAKRTTIAGTGKWQEAVWYVTDVKFDGVNVPTQAATRFSCAGPVYFSRVRIGVIRNSGMYQGVDPIPDVYPFDPDPFFNYAELDIHTDRSEGLALGNNGGDQEYLVEEGVGPAGDTRKALRPALNKGTSPFDRYVNFSIIDQWFGPSSQPNAKIKIAVDYWDNPAIAGERFGPEVYQSDEFGTMAFHFFPDELRVTIEGTDTWRTATWLIEDMNFAGVNQGPQAAARFWFSDECAVHISRVRYAVIRPKGQYAGEDKLADLTPITPVTEWSLY